MRTGLRERGGDLLVHVVRGVAVAASGGDDARQRLCRFRGKRDASLSLGTAVAPGFLVSSSSALTPAPMLANLASTLAFAAATRACSAARR